jgi:hypothetical protein
LYQFIKADVARLMARYVAITTTITSTVRPL